MNWKFYWTLKLEPKRTSSTPPQDLEKLDQSSSLKSGYSINYIFSIEIESTMSPLRLIKKESKTTLTTITSNTLENIPKNKPINLTLLETTLQVPLLEKPIVKLLEINKFYIITFISYIITLCIYH